MYEILENVKNSTSELLKKGMNTYEEIKENFQATEFYSNLPEFLKKAGGWIALTPLSMVLIIKALGETFKKEKTRVIKHYVHDPTKKYDPAFSEKRAKEISKKLMFFEYDETNPKMIETVALFFRMQDKFHKDDIFGDYKKPRSRMPTDFALLYYSLLNPDLIPVSFDSDLFDAFKTWLTDSENDVLDEELRKTLDFNLLSPITPFKVTSGNKYLLDSNIIMGYKIQPVNPKYFPDPRKRHNEEIKRANQSEDIKEMFRQAIEDNSIELHIIPLVIEEIDYKDGHFGKVEYDILDRAKKEFYEKRKKDEDSKLPKKKWATQRKYR